MAEEKDINEMLTHLVKLRQKMSEVFGSLPWDLVDSLEQIKNWITTKK